MELKQVSENCFAVLNEKNRLSDATSGLINRGGGVVIDTQSDLPHARKMIELFGKVWPAMAKRVINTHEDADHIWGNQLFPDAEIIASKSTFEHMTQAEVEEGQHILHGVADSATRQKIQAVHPGLVAVGQQLLEDFNFDGIELKMPTTVFDTRHQLNLEGTEVELIYVGPCHQFGDTIVHVPKERVVFTGDVLFRLCTPLGWTGTYKKWIQALDLIIQLKPDVVVAGHGPLCGIEGPTQMKAYLEYVYAESKKHFADGVPAVEAAKKIEFGPYGEWKAPGRLYMNVERAYREFRNEPYNAPWDKAAAFDAILAVTKAKGIPFEM